MTIIKVAPEKPYKPPDPEIGDIPCKPEDTLPEGETLPVPVAISVRKPSKRRRCSGCVTLALVLACGLVTIGLVTGLYLWHKNYGLAKRRGFCGVGYLDGDSSGAFTEHVEIPSDSLEIVEVPKIGTWQRARILHDFEVAKTAIEDVDKRRCFIMDLDRSVVKPPETVWELIVKLRRGDYMPKAEVIRRTMRVSHGPLRRSELKKYGPYIFNACSNLASYTLEPANDADRVLDREPRAPTFRFRRNTDEVIRYGGEFGSGPVLFEIQSPI